jgi:hypothetical protein
MLQTPFLIAKVGDNMLVGGLGEQRDIGGGMAEILAKTSHKIGQEEGVSDRKI